MREFRTSYKSSFLCGHYNIVMPCSAVHVDAYAATLVGDSLLVTNRTSFYSSIHSAALFMDIKITNMKYCSHS